MSTFNELYSKYEKHFIFKNGQAKLNTIKTKIETSAKIARVNGLSIQAKIAPTRADFSSHIHEIPYFIFAGSETVAMAEFIAVKYWNDEINSVYHLCSEYELFYRGNAILNNWKIRL